MFQSAHLRVKVTGRHKVITIIGKQIYTIFQDKNSYLKRDASSPISVQPGQVEDPFQKFVQLISFLILKFNFTYVCRILPIGRIGDFSKQIIF